MTDFDTAHMSLTLEATEQARAVVVCAKYARDDDELQTFVQMLGLVDN